MVSLGGTQTGEGDWVLRSPDLARVSLLLSRLTTKLFRHYDFHFGGISRALRHADSTSKHCPLFAES